MTLRSPDIAIFYFYSLHLLTLHTLNPPNHSFMSKKLFYLPLGIATLLTAVSAFAQSPASTSSDQPSITATINNSGVITVTHPAALELRLLKASAATDSVAAEQPAKPAAAGKVKKAGGYRVQVYSDNNARTAKNEARSKERAISGAFPELATYVIYDSPYWRLRVGDCRSKAEAEELAAQLKKAFPAYRAEITVVRDRINTVN